MHLFIEHHWTFEYTSSSHKDTADSGDQWPGAHEHILPSRETSTFAVGSRFKLNWIRKPKRSEQDATGFSESKESVRTSRVRSIRKRIGKLCENPFSRPHSPPPPYWQAELPSQQPTSMANSFDTFNTFAELPGDSNTFELLGSGVPEMAAEPSYHTCRQAPATVYDEGHHSFVFPQSDYNASPFAYTPRHMHMSPQEACHVQMAYIQSTPSRSLPQDVSPIEKSLKRHDAVRLRARPSATGSPVSASSSTTVSPISPFRTDASTTTCPCGPWGKDLRLDRQASNTRSPSYPFSPFSVGHGNQHQADHHSISPINSRRSSCAQGSFDQPISLSTPPVNSPSQLGNSINSLATQHHPFNRNHFSFSPQNSHKRDFSIPSAATLYRPDALIQDLEDIEGASQLEFQMPSPGAPAQLRQGTDSGSLNSFDDTMSSLTELSTTTSSQRLYGTPMSHIASDAIKSVARETKKLAEKFSPPPLPCSICGKVFNGLYQNGNRKRHVLAFHSDNGSNDNDKKCRKCSAVYKRADARRKHEWKKHKIPDTRPEKRRPRPGQQHDPGNLDTQTTNQSVNR